MKRLGLCAFLALVCVLAACGKVEEEAVSSDAEVSVSVETVYSDKTVHVSADVYLPKEEEKSETEAENAMEVEEDPLPLYTAPKDYEDRDIYGYFGEDPDDYLYFYPVTDDYCLDPGHVVDRYLDNIHVYFGCSYLCSYNENGICVDEKLKYVFENEDDAKAYNDFGIQGDMFPRSDDDYESHQVGNLIYVTYDNGNNFCTKMEGLYLPLYKDCHYLFETHPSYSLKDGEIIYEAAFLSKPYTEAELNVSIEDTDFWEKISGKRFRGTNQADCCLNVRINDHKRLVFNFEESSDGDALGFMHFLDIDEMRVKGRTVFGLTPCREWTDEDNFIDQLIFTEMVFDETSAKVKIYKFNVKDFSSTKINFDNFKTKKADSVIEDTFVLE